MPELQGLILRVARLLRAKLSAPTQSLTLFNNCQCLVEGLAQDEIGDLHCAKCGKDLN